VTDSCDATQPLKHAVNVTERTFDRRIRQSQNLMAGLCSLDSSQFRDLKTKVSSLKSTQVQFLKVSKPGAKTLVSRKKDLAQDQDLIQWQGYRKYRHTATFKSRSCTAGHCSVQFISATAWMPANPDMVVHKSASMCA